MFVQVMYVDGAWRVVWDGKIVKTFASEAQAEAYATEAGVHFPKARRRKEWEVMQ